MSAPAAAAIADPAVRAAFREWLLRVADDELTIGHRHSEWTGVGPDIESDVAMSSIAQEELGHARLFYEQVAGLDDMVAGRVSAGNDSGGADRLAFGRGPDDYRNAVLLELPNQGWEFSIIRLALYEAFEGLRLGLLAQCGQEPVAGLAATLGREERYHGLFASTWLERLAGAPGPAARPAPDGDAGVDDMVAGRVSAGGTAGARAKVQAALDTAWPYALGFFETTPADEVLRGAGVLTQPAAQQREHWEAAVRPLLARCRLTVPAAAPREGGRRGEHTADLAQLHREMTEVWRSDPEARW